MNDLIKINYDTEQPTVSARELYGKIGSTERFSTWFERQLQYGFEKNTDYTGCKKFNTLAHQELQDYDLSINMAKEICIVQKNEHARAIRKYLIQLDNAWNTPEQVMARALQLAQQTVDGLKEKCQFLGGQVIEQQKVIEEMQPKASYYDLVLQCKDLIATTVIAKDYGMSAQTFNTILHDMKIQYKQSKTWVLYAKYQGQGYLKTKTHNYADSEGGMHTNEHSYWTQKGRLFLYELLKEKGYLPVIEQESTLFLYSSSKNEEAYK